MKLKNCLLIHGMLNTPERAGILYARRIADNMKMLQRNISMLCLIAMLFSMTACGHNTKDEEAPESYVASFFDIPDSVTYISRLLISDNKA